MVFFNWRTFFDVGGRGAVDGLALPTVSMVFSLQLPLVGRGITPKVGVDGIPMVFSSGVDGVPEAGLDGVPVDDYFLMVK